MTNPKKITFFGAGVNAGSLSPRITDDSRIPRRPQGATWPFARLSITEKSVKFDIDLLFIHKDAHAADVTVDLSKLGYVFFRTPAGKGEFGFLTLRMDTLLHQLSEHGFQLDESCERNLQIARILPYAMTTFGTIFLLLAVIGTLKQS